MLFSEIIFLSLDKSTCNSDEIRRVLSKKFRHANIHFFKCPEDMPESLNGSDQALIFADYDSLLKLKTKKDCYQYFDEISQPVIFMVWPEQIDDLEEVESKIFLDYFIKNKDDISELPRMIKRVSRSWQVILTSKRAEEKAAFQEKTLMNIVSQAPTAVLILQENKICFSNQAGAKFLGHSNPEAVLGKDIFGYVEHESLAFVSEWFDNPQNEIFDYPGEIKIRGADGKVRWVTTSALRIEFHGKEANLIICSDTTARKSMEEALRESEEKYRLLTETTQDAILVHDLSGQIEYVNQAFVDFAGYSHEIILLSNVLDFVPETEIKKMKSRKDARLSGNQMRMLYETEFLHRSGKYIPIEVSSSPIQKDAQVTSILLAVRDISTRKESERAIRESEEQYRLLVTTMDEGLALHEAVFDDAGNMIDSMILEVNDRFIEVTGLKREEIVGKNVRSVLPNVDISWIERFAEVVQSGEPIHIEDYSIPLGKYFRIVAYRVRENQFAVILSDITEKIRTVEIIRQNEARLERAEKVANFGNWELHLGQNVMRASSGAAKIYGVAFDEEWPLDFVQTIPLKEYRAVLDQALMDLVTHNKPYNIEFKIKRENDGMIRDIHSIAEFDREKKVLFGVIHDITDRKDAERALLKSYQETKLHLHRLNVLHQIDRIMTEKFDRSSMLQKILRQITELELVDGAILFYPQNDGRFFEVAAQNGIPGSHLKHLVGDRHQFCLQNSVNEASSKVAYRTTMSQNVNSHCTCVKHEFSGCAVLPLMIGNENKGVLQVLSKKDLAFDQEWIEFLQSVALQIAIALDRSEIFTQVKQAHLDLSEAYESTLRGWSKALEMREQETHGHSERVVELTVSLAREFGFSEDEIAHIRRGALLHDIGKMGIPDDILLKPGPLTETEWKKMREHTIYAQKFLEEIAYLEPAMDIPFSHHEKWDGSGYPNGLRGEEIPLAARIFAIVDVWDALNQNRPYRKAWEQEKIVQFLKDQKGKHFDPQVVDSFLRIINKEMRDI